MASNVEQPATQNLLSQAREYLHNPRDAIPPRTHALVVALDELGLECVRLKVENSHLHHQTNKLGEDVLRLRAEVAVCRKDAKRLDWMQRHFFERKWDGTIGRKCDWYLVGNYRHVAQRMRGDTFREAIDAALGGEGINERRCVARPRRLRLGTLEQDHFPFEELPILEVAMMMTGELTRRDTDFRRAPWPRLLARYARPAWRARTKPALLRLLRTQLRDADRRFRRAGELELLQLITRFDGVRGTKLAWWNHGIAHEEYHRGQLALYARLLGQEPALTRRIRALTGRPAALVGGRIVCQIGVHDRLLRRGPPQPV